MTGDGEFDRSVLAGASRVPVAGACLSEAQLATFYEGALSERDAEIVRDHIASCPACVELARDAREFVASMAVVPVRTRFTRRRLLLAAAAAVAVVTLIVTVGRIAGRGSSGGVPFGVVTPAPYEPADGLVWRDGSAPAAGTLDAAASRYRAGDYAAAAVDLAAYVSAHPTDPRGLFYLGVSRLLAGQPARAVGDLEGAMALPDAPEASAWYHALALLHAGDDRRARAALARIADSDPKHRDEARDLLRRLAARGVE